MVLIVEDFHLQDKSFHALILAAFIQFVGRVCTTIGCSAMFTSFFSSSCLVDSSLDIPTGFKFGNVNFVQFKLNSSLDVQPGF